MKEPNVIPGFADRRQRSTAHKRLVLLRIFVILLPLAALLAIDITGRFTYLRPGLLLLPLLDLRKQAVIWYRYLERFGFPPFSHCRKMLYLDTLRGYDARTNNITPGSRLPMSAIVELSLLLIAISWAIWKLTSLSAVLYLGVFFFMLAIKALIRRARPPAVLFLGASSLVTSRFLLRIMRVAHPLNVVACLHHEPMGPLLDDVLGFFSFRTGDNKVWQEMVSSLVAVSPLVVLDVRKATLPVDYEINVSVKTVSKERLFFVGDQPEHPSIPPDRCFGEGPLVEALYDLLWGSSHAPAAKTTRRADRTKAAQWSDQRNGYFTWMPPAGWNAHESEDSRTKVQFVNPDAPAVQVRFIVKEASGPGNAPPANALRQAKAMGVQCQVAETIILGVPSSEVRMSMPNQEESVLWLFVKDGLHFNIQFYAPSLTAFRKHYQTVRRALETIAIVAQPPQATSKALAQRLDQKLRVARLAAEHISIEEAQRVLTEARIEFCNDLQAVAAIDNLLAELAQAKVKR